MKSYDVAECGAPLKLFELHRHARQTARRCLYRRRAQARPLLGRSERVEVAVVVGGVEHAQVTVPHRPTHRDAGHAVAAMTT